MYHKRSEHLIIMAKFKIIAFMFLALALLAGVPSGSDLFSYVDQDGTRIFTNIGARGGSVPDLEMPVKSLGIDSSRISRESVYYEDIINHYASEHKISGDLVKAVIQVESNYDPYAVSSKDCKGLMQLHPDTASRFGVEDVFNPEENISGGIKYLSFLMNHFDNNLNFALAAYNSGENTVKKYKGIPPYPETINYVEKVKSLAGLEDKPDTQKRRAVKIVRTVDENGNVMLSNF